MYREAHHYDERHPTMQTDPDSRSEFLNGTLVSWPGISCEAAISAGHAELQRANELGTTPLIVCDLGCAYAFSGKKTEARAILNSLESKSQFSYVSPYLIASIYSALGEKDEAFKWLEKAYDRRDGISYLVADPMMDPLRSDPRFAHLIQRLHLPK